MLACQFIAYSKILALELYFILVLLPVVTVIAYCFHRFVVLVYSITILSRRVGGWRFALVCEKFRIRLNKQISKDLSFVGRQLKQKAPLYFSGAFFIL